MKLHTTWNLNLLNYRKKAKLNLTNKKIGKVRNKVTNFAWYKITGDFKSNIFYIIETRPQRPTGGYDQDFSKINYCLFCHSCLLVKEKVKFTDLNTKL